MAVDTLKYIWIVLKIYKQISKAVTTEKNCLFFISVLLCKVWYQIHISPLFVRIIYKILQLGTELVKTLQDTLNYICF